MKKIIALFLVLLLTLAVGCNEKKPTPGKKDTTTSSSTVTDSSDENSSSEDTVSDNSSKASEISSAESRADTVISTVGELCRYRHNSPYADILEMPIFDFLKYWIYKTL